MHISSLPSQGHIGTLGQSAYRFADWLSLAGQTLWQILPLCPVGNGYSPYQSCSAFAGNPLFIDADMLERDGLLTSAQRRSFCAPGESRVNYCAAMHTSERMLRTAFAAFRGGEQYEKFLSEASDWLEPYVMFMTLRSINGGRALQEWKKDSKPFSSEIFAQLRSQHPDELDYHRFVQYKFYEQWFRLKSYVNSLGIEIIGDMPIYVSADSADVWSAPEQFLLDDALNPIAVAGCPPDEFSADGQKWGNPLYRWDCMAHDGFAWWRRRLAWSERLYDITRIDHVQGFTSYYAIPADKPASAGEWQSARGDELLDGLCRDNCLPRLIAEDLGTVTPYTKQMIEKYGLPGMCVLQYAFDSGPGNPYLPHNCRKNQVIYTGTHDNDTVLGWTDSADKASLAFARRYLSQPAVRPLANQLIHAAAASVCDYCVFPAQDILTLDSQARMNIPSTVGGNWLWRAEHEMLSARLARKMRELSSLYGRI